MVGSSSVEWIGRGKPAAGRAIILAAGRGTRLGSDVHGNRPKALVEVGGRTILEHQVRALAEVGVTEVVVVVGFREQLLRLACEDLGRTVGVSFRFVRNPDYATTNTSVSVHLAAPEMDVPFFLLNGDVLFAAPLLDALHAAGRGVALAVDVKKCGDEEVKVQVERDGRLKAISKQLAPADAEGEFIGIARLEPEPAKRFAEALGSRIERHGGMTYYDYAFAELPDAYPVHAVRFRDEPMIEIDFPEDLARAEREVLPRLAAKVAAP